MSSAEHRTSLRHSPSSEPGGGHGRLVLVRHGRTSWSHGGRHTGRTDVPLDDVGRAQARALPALLERVLRASPALVLSSPLSRARETAELAGLAGPGGGAPETSEDLAEWDYGAYEGRTTPDIRAERGDDWRVFRDGVEPGGPGGFPGEDLAAVAARTARVLERVRAVLPAGDVVLVAHGHLLRVLAATWLEAPPQAGSQLLLDAAAVCVLDAEHGVPGVRHWNLSPAVFPG